MKRFQVQLRTAQPPRPRFVAFCIFHALTFFAKVAASALQSLHVRRQTRPRYQHTAELEHLLSERIANQKRNDIPVTSSSTCMTMRVCISPSSTCILACTRTCTEWLGARTEVEMAHCAEGLSFGGVGLGTASSLNYRGDHVSL